MLWRLISSRLVFANHLFHLLTAWRSPNGGFGIEHTQWHAIIERLLSSSELFQQRSDAVPVVRRVRKVFRFVWIGSQIEKLSHIHFGIADEFPSLIAQRPLRLGERQEYFLAHAAFLTSDDARQVTTFTSFRRG